MFGYQFTKKSVQSFPKLALLLTLGASIQAQDNPEGRIVDLLAPEQGLDEGAFPPPDHRDSPPKPPWRDLQPREFTSMLFTIMYAAEDIQELSPSDKAVLAAGAEGVRAVNVRGLQHLDVVCREVLSGEFVGDRGASEAARLFARGDQMQEEDATAFFENVIGSLSTEGREAVIEYKDAIFRLNTSANFIDWETYAELAPREMLERATKNCERRLR